MLLLSILLPNKTYFIPEVWEWFHPINKVTWMRLSRDCVICHQCLHIPTQSNYTPLAYALLSSYRQLITDSLWIFKILLEDKGKKALKQLFLLSWGQENVTRKMRQTIWPRLIICLLIQHISCNDFSIIIYCIICGLI